MKDIAKLELKTLELLDFDIIITEQDYDKVVSFYK